MHTTKSTAATWCCVRWNGRQLQTNAASFVRVAEVAEAFALAPLVPDLLRDRQRLREVADGLGMPPEAVVRAAEVAEAVALAPLVPYLLRDRQRLRDVAERMPSVPPEAVVCAAEVEVRLIYRDGHCKQRLAAHTLKREGRFACLDRCRELGAVCLADGND